MRPEVNRILDELKYNLQTANEALYANRSSTPTMQEIATNNCQKAEHNLKQLEDFLADEAA